MKIEEMKLQICCHVIQLWRRVEGREGRQLSDQQDLTVSMEMFIDKIFCLFCFFMVQKMLLQLCEVVTSTEFLEGSL